MVRPYSGSNPSVKDCPGKRIHQCHIPISIVMPKGTVLLTVKRPPVKLEVFYHVILYLLIQNNTLVKPSEGRYFVNLEIALK